MYPKMYLLMSRRINWLNAAKVRTITRPGRYANGAGLWMQVDETCRSWLFPYTFAVANGRSGWVRSERSGTLTLAVRRKLRMRRCATASTGSHSAGWKNLKHANQWSQSL